MFVTFRQPVDSSAAAHHNQSAERTNTQAMSSTDVVYAQLRRPSPGQRLTSPPAAPRAALNTGGDGNLSHDPLTNHTHNVSVQSPPRQQGRQGHGFLPRQTTSQSLDSSTE